MNQNTEFLTRLIGKLSGKYLDRYGNVAGEIHDSANEVWQEASDRHRKEFPEPNKKLHEARVSALVVKNGRESVSNKVGMLCMSVVAQCLLDQEADA